MHTVMRLPDLIIGAAILLFASWTLSQNLCYFAGLSPSVCLPTAGLLLAVLSLGLYVFGRGGLRSNGGEHECRKPLQATSANPLAAPALLLAFSLALAVFVDPCFLVMGLAVAAVAGFASKTEEECDVHVKPPADGRKFAMVPVALAIAASIYATYLKAYNPDDVQYLATSAYVATHFHSPFPDHFPLFPYANLAPPYPTYSLVAYHDWIGVLSHVLDWEPVEVVSYLMTPFCAFLLVVAYHAFLREIVPEGVLWYSLAVAIGFLVFEQGRHQSFGNFSFERIWQGKSILLHVGIPLLLLKVNAFLSTRHAVDLLWAWLVATCCVGLSSVSLWLVPPVVVAFIVPDLLRECMRQRWSLCFQSLAIIWHPVLLAGWAYLGSVKAMQHREETASYASSVISVFGSTLNAAVVLFVVGAGMLLIRKRAVRQRLSSLVLLFCLTLGNPLMAAHVSSHVTSPVVYWRIWWFLPVGILVGSAFGSIGMLVRNRAFALAEPAVICLLFCILVVTANGRPKPLRAKPTLKVPVEAYRHLVGLHGVLPETSYVLACRPHNGVIPTIMANWYAIMPHDEFAHRAIELRMGRREDYQRRLQLTDYLSGKGSYDPQLWIRMMDAHPLNVVIAKSEIAQPDALRELLAARGFTEVQHSNLLVWIRQSDVPTAPFILNE